MMMAIDMKEAEEFASNIRMRLSTMQVRPGEPNLLFYDRAVEAELADRRLKDSVYQARHDTKESCELLALRYRDIQIDGSTARIAADEIASLIRKMELPKRDS